MSTDFRASFIKSKPAGFLLFVIGVTVFLGFLGWRFYSQVPEDTRTLIQRRTLTPHDELYAIHFPREGRGWAVGKFGIILHTQDGGKSWNQQNSGTTKPLTSVSFADERLGFAVGGGGTVLVTRDAGRIASKKLRYKRTSTRRYENMESHGGGNGSANFPGATR